MYNVILYNGPIHQSAEEILSKIADITLVKRIEELSQKIQNADALILRAPAITKEILANANKLKVIVRHGIGFDSIPLNEATKKGIVVANTPTANTQSVVEHVIGMILLLSRNFHKLDGKMRESNWDYRNQVNSVELQGKKIGIIGIGNIGKQVGYICKIAFNMKVLAYDPYCRRFPKGIQMVPLEIIFKESDYVTLHIPLTSSTENLIDERYFSLMKKEAFFINTSRGPIVNEDSLCNAIRNKQIAGAALDVYCKEPLPNKHPFLKLENVILTPHSAALTAESIRRMGLQSVNEVIRVLKGEKPINLVNPHVYKLF